MSECLPSRISLRKKHVEVEPGCPVCGLFTETNFHCLVYCQFAWERWELAGISSVGREFGSIREWMEEVMNTLDLCGLNQVVVICRAV